MHETHERTRYYLTIPDDDPRFGRMRAVLDKVQGSGRKSPASRMLAEWALLGFALQQGLLNLLDADILSSIPADTPDPNHIAAQRRAIEASMAEFGFD